VKKLIATFLIGGLLGAAGGSSTWSATSQSGPARAFTFT
jgi:hypothetical protein